MEKRGRTPFIIAFLFPAVALYGIFVVLPVLEAFGYSLFRWRGISTQKEFVGFSNFAALAVDPVFWRSVEHNLFLLIGAGSAILILSLAVAHALGGESRPVRALRGVYLFPQVISLVVVAILWMFIFDPAMGLLTGAMRVLHLPVPASGWLGSSTTALAAVALTFVWHGLGFYIMLFAAGLRAIPADVQEAALLDGAVGLTRFRSVTFPMLWSIMRVATIYLVIQTLNVFALVFLMTVGGPDRSSEVILTYLYETGFRHSQFGLATALAVANLIVIMGVSGLVMLALRRDPQEAPR